MTKVFFTYVWGPPGNPAWPLTFATKAARSHAKKVLSEGDFVFTIGTRGDPTASEHRGKVVGVFQVSDLEVNTQDYDLPRNHARPEFDGVTRFPYALHPLAVWQITSPGTLFSSLVGPLTPNHHLQAQSKIVELDATTAAPLLTLERQQVPPTLPRTEFGRGLVALKNSKLAPKHQGEFSGTFADHDIWFVYALVLQDGRKKVLATKVGYSFEPEQRAAAHNAPMASEVTGLRWQVFLKQATSSEDAARQIEQAVLARYAKHRLASNGEIIVGVDPLMVASTIADIMRSN
ncbi:hypothetical protein [Sinorhizobium mexicanum]|uniref:Uncharacterized protein n=1 Tax=Sinorhizobium mexicanum TaxID=375549 RepID=A0A859QGX6_9HYPH|nr:hypothetical protein [Sinorhizobium mexicanum]MBP1885710.1 hypothetical protein [Sinorhizobium mexicanum]QLL63484.1 hypothetical protein FKV68_19570 [Sinorhizobium mexicanum]